MAPCGIVNCAELVFERVDDEVSAVLLQPDKMALATTKDNKVGLKFMFNLKNSQLKDDKYYIGILYTFKLNTTLYVT